MVEEKSNTIMEKVVRILSIIIFLFTIIILIWYKVNHADFNIKWVFIIGGSVAIVSLLLWFGFSISRLFKDDSSKNENKPEINLEQANVLSEQMIGEAFYDIWDFKEIGIEEHGENVKQKIYWAYGDGNLGRFDNQKYFVAINMHCPETNRVHLLNPSEMEMKEAIKKLPSDPEKPSAKRITEEENPLLGSKRRITEITPSKDKKEEDKEKKEGLQ